jgi:hypothetical protein
MKNDLDSVLTRAISFDRVRPDGRLTRPRSYGVYLLPVSHGTSRRVRFGNHPVRQRELEMQFGCARLMYLFLSRQDAAAAAKILEGLQV